MKILLSAFWGLIWCSIIVSAQQIQSLPAQKPVPAPPNADHHQHIFSKTYVGNSTTIKVIEAKDVIALLDDAGIKRGLLLSTAYSYGRPGREPVDEYERVKAENDWTGAQAALYPKRLVAFCGFNPLKDYALGELERCSKNPKLKRGLKFHFGNSDVRLELPEHVEKLKAVFKAANDRRMAIVVHMRASYSLQRPYGAEQARIFLEQLMPLATNITVQVAHLTSSGPGYNDLKAHEALEFFAAAFEKRDPRTKNLWFDVTTSAHPNNTPEISKLLAGLIRRIGVKKILYGSDAAVGGNLRPRESWAAFCQLDLTEKELKTIGKNEVPYLK
jgi:uncharacterized protein